MTVLRKRLKLFAPPPRLVLLLLIKPLFSVFGSRTTKNTFIRDRKKSILEVEPEQAGPRVGVVVVVVTADAGFVDVVLKTNHSLAISMRKPLPTMNPPTQCWG